jgi:hypothetical protein
MQSFWFCNQLRYTKVVVVLALMKFTLRSGVGSLAVGRTQCALLAARELRCPTLHVDARRGGLLNLALHQDFDLYTYLQKWSK